MQKLRGYQWWFGAAAIYNAMWGATVCLFPNLFFDLIGLPHPNYPSTMQALGMVVGVYAIGYALVAKDPVRFGPFVYVGLLGKILGPLGMAWLAFRGQLPWTFGWMNVFNDLIWLPAFIAFALQVYKRERSLGATVD